MRILVRATDNLQAAFDAARPGDVIELERGAVFRGNFRLPRHGTIRNMLVVSEGTL